MLCVVHPSCLENAALNIFPTLVPTFGTFPIPFHTVAHHHSWPLVRTSALPGRALCRCDGRLCIVSTQPLPIRTFHAELRSRSSPPPFISMAAVLTSSHPHLDHSGTSLRCLRKCVRSIMFSSSRTTMSRPSPAWPITPSPCPPSTGPKSRLVNHRSYFLLPSPSDPLHIARVTITVAALVTIIH